MILEANVGGRRVRVELQPRGSGCEVFLDGRPLHFDLVETNDGFTSLLLDGRSHELAVEPGEDGAVVHFAGGGRLQVVLAAGGSGLAPTAPRRATEARLTAPMPGRVVRVLVTAGETVEAGQGLVVVEAMKMENELRSPRSGRVEQVAVREGQAVDTGALLVLVT